VLASLLFWSFFFEFFFSFWNYLGFITLATPARKGGRRKRRRKALREREHQSVREAERV
jgi:hypothetical protein